MKLMRIGPEGKESPAALVGDDLVVDLSDVVSDIDERWLGTGAIASLGAEIDARVVAGRAEPIGDRRIGSPIARPHQILCVGLNYSDHAAESGMALPEEPILFTKAPNSLSGPFDPVRMPRGATQLDWEVELGIVIGSRLAYAEDAAEAEAAIAGYVLVNDMSERDFQLSRGGQWLKGKSAETFCPVGPWLVTRDEAEVDAAGMWLDVNGTRRQTGSTATMVTGPVEIVRYVSQFLVLEPGDLICTGTPPGVGMGMKPPTYLAEGDVMRLGIDGLGVQEQTVIGPR